MYEAEDCCASTGCEKATLPRFSIAARWQIGRNRPDARGGIRARGASSTESVQPFSQISMKHFGFRGVKFERVMQPRLDV